MANDVLLSCCYEEEIKLAKLIWRFLALLAVYRI